MSYNLQRSTHFNQQQSELATIQRDIAHGAYGFRNTFDEWAAKKERAADPPETEEGGEDEMEYLRRTR